jgi:8-oxo-dGTP pyrophosphatase MutT (NUDIX family)
VTTPHDEALATLTGWRPPDSAQDLLRRRYVEHLHAHPSPTGGLSRDDVPAHLTAGALVLSADRSHVLLTLHAKAGRWFHLGGHCEPGDTSLAAAALREATEEGGVRGVVLDPVPLDLDAHVVGFCGSRPEVEHLDVRFAAVAPDSAVPQVSEESLDVRWWPVGALPTDEPGVLRMVARALERDAPQRSSAAI